MGAQFPAGLSQAGHSSELAPQLDLMLWLLAGTAMDYSGGTSGGLSDFLKLKVI